MHLLRRKTCPGVDGRRVVNTSRTDGNTARADKEAEEKSVSKAPFGHHGSGDSTAIQSDEESDMDDEEPSDEYSTSYRYKSNPNKRSRSERNEQSQAVSNVSQQLAYYASKKPVLGTLDGRTYDDDLADSDTFSVTSEISAKAEEFLTSTVSPHFSFQQTKPRSSSLSILLPEKFEQPKKKQPTSFSYNVDQVNKIARKIDMVAPGPTAAILAFCLSTPPSVVMSERGMGGIDALLKENFELMREFNKYRDAMSPRSYFAVEPTEAVEIEAEEEEGEGRSDNESPALVDDNESVGSNESEGSGNSQGSRASTSSAVPSFRDFTPFAVNHLNALKREGITGKAGFTPKEAKLVDQMCEAWWTAVTCQ